MKVLFITNYYPPSQFGWGYMQLCEEVADGLSARGHSVAVLTSDQIDGKEIPRPYPVYRQLPIDPDFYNKHSPAWQFFFGRRQREQQALEHLNTVLEEFDPEIIFIWHAIGLPKALFRALEGTERYKVVYYLADYQPELADEYMDYWKGKPVHTKARLLKQPLSGFALQMLAREGKPIRLKYEHAICVSDFVRRRLVTQKLISSQAVVVHNGVDLTRFAPDGNSASQSPSGQIRCLIAGRIIPNKGIHTVIDAFANPEVKEKRGRVTLTILGVGQADYLKSLEQKIIDNDLQGCIHFQPPVPRSQMPGVLSSHDVVILASEYDEPLARASQEAMAMGLLVIGTITGGSGELLIHNKTGLVFEAGNPGSLAEQLVRAVEDPELVEQLKKAGQEEVVRNFDIQRTIAQIEAYLLALLGKETVTTDGN